MSTQAALDYVAALLAANPLEEPIERFLRLSEHAPIAPLHVGRDAYLDFAERIVRRFAPYQHECGCILDPTDGVEYQYSTASYAKAGAVLLANGRCVDLAESVLRAMDWACFVLGTLRDIPFAKPAGASEFPASFVMANRPDHSRDFMTHMLMRAYRILSERTPAGRANAWAAHLASVAPEETYTQNERNFPIAAVRNWATYAMHGEMMRYADGLAADDAYIEKYLPYQLPRFTEEGLYRDPNLPAAYDLAARQQLTGLLDEGYAGPHRAALETLLRRGAVTMLFTQSTTGASGPGGRSNQLIWNELTFASICEREAARRRRDGDLRWAPVFKRAARLAFHSLQPWIAEEPPRLAKNRFPIEDRSGLEHYAFYCNYMLYAAQIAASCYEHADDTIPEGAAPCDVGGYALHLPSFHRVYATATPAQGGYHLVFDNAAQMGQDATGLVRLHRRGVPEALGLSAGIPGMEGDVSWLFFPPKQNIPYAKLPCAVGVAWRDGEGVWHSFANYGRRKHDDFSKRDETGRPLEEERPAWRTELLAPADDGATGPDAPALVFALAFTPAVDPAAAAEPELANEELRKMYRLVKANTKERAGIGGLTRIEQRVVASQGAVDVEWTLFPAEGGTVTRIAAIAPMLASDGERLAELTAEGRTAAAALPGGQRYRATALDADATLELLPDALPNRNGYYRKAEWTRANATSIRLRLELTD
ncbi:hypothetical protein [Paenibacillus sp.]|uniref:hypothetical protein n=1 Tax=Paenibacillus sp. TaxID=58172 RepID=UPI002D5698D2|nr:hypothetical protein [Paenibacillus sp.]HZG56011.1 hypothetical protein [Paenibacillus sp.]